jgi:hypothetical protein
MSLREATEQLTRWQRKIQADATRRTMVAAYQKCPSAELAADINRIDAERLARGELIDYGGPAADFARGGIPGTAGLVSGHNPDGSPITVPPAPSGALPIPPPDERAAELAAIRQRLRDLEAKLAGFPIPLPTQNQE